MRSTKLKTTIIIVFAVLVVVFTLQNTEVVNIKLWFWQVNTSRALMIVLSIAVGIIFGMLLPAFKKYKRKNDSDQDDPGSSDEDIKIK